MSVGFFNRRSIVSIAFGLVSVLGTVAPVAADIRDFKFTNLSGHVVDQLYVAPSASSAWEEDILGADVLLNGEAVQVVFSRFNPVGCLHDIRAITEDGSTVEAYEFDLCTTLEVDFTGPNAEYAFYYR